MTITANAERVGDPIYSAIQSLNIQRSAGDPLPTVWKRLGERGTKFQRGQLSLICAAPGVGKSAFVLSYAIKARIPTLYFSIDSDESVQVSRMASIVTGQPMEKSKTDFRRRDMGSATAALLDTWVLMDYDSDTIDSIQDALNAYDALYEEWPQLIVIDNASNIQPEPTEAGEILSGADLLMDYFNKLARDTGAAVIALHHVTGEYNNGTTPIPLNGVRGQLGRVPSVILTLHRDKGLFNVSTVKNRTGWSDPSGQDFVSLRFDDEHMQIS
jgi:hypothetical protein